MKNLTPYKKSITQSFTAATHTYDQAAFVEQQIGLRLLDRLDGLQLQPQRILDLGGGTGYFTQHLRSRFPQASIISLDIAFGMVKFASNNTKISDIKYICADAEFLPFAAQTFDLIFANCCLMHLQQLENVCSGLKKILSASGRLVFSALGPRSLHELAMPAPWLDMHLYGDALLKAQFTDPVVDVEVLTFTYDKLRDLLQDLSETGAYQIDDVSDIANIDEPCAAQFEVIYGSAWGNNNLPRQSKDANGNVLIPITSITYT